MMELVIYSFVPNYRGGMGMCAVKLHIFGEKNTQAHLIVIRE